MKKISVCLGFALALLPTVGCTGGPSMATTGGSSPAPAPAPAAARSTGAGTSDWLTWGGGPERHSWAKDETTLSPENVGDLELKWVAQLDNPEGELVLASVTAPLVASGVATMQGLKTLVYVVGSEDIVYALDSETGGVVWRREIPQTVTTDLNPTWLCPLTQNATPVIDKQAGIIYVITSEGKLIGLDIASGRDRMEPREFVTPFARAWSLNLIDGYIYTSLGRGCGGAAAEMAAMNLADPSEPVHRFNTSPARPSGAWGRGGPVLGPRGLYMMTATGTYNPEEGLFGDSFLLFEPKTMRLLDWFSPENRDYIRQKDYGGSTSPFVVNFQGRDIVVGTNKESVVWMLDAHSLGGADHETPLYTSPRWANDDGWMHGRGVWGAMATWEDPNGERWIYIPIWGPPAKPFMEWPMVHGMQESGSIMAFRMGMENGAPTLIPAWISASMDVPEPPVVANGVVFSFASGENTRQQGWGSAPAQKFQFAGTGSLHAFDAITGKELYDSGSIVDDWSHFGSLAVANGRVYFTTHDSRVYSFGLP